MCINQRNKKKEREGSKRDRVLDFISNLGRGFGLSKSKTDPLIQELLSGGVRPHPQLYPRYKNKIQEMQREESKNTE